MSVIYYDYDKKPNHIVPAPMVNISKSMDKDGAGETVGVRYSITLTGTLLAFRGSPDSAGRILGTDAWSGEHGATTKDVTEVIAPNKKLLSIQQKQQALRNLFSKENEGALLEIKPLDGTRGFRCYPRIISIDFPETAGWVQRSDYTISLEADELMGPGATG